MDTEEVAVNMTCVNKYSAPSHKCPKLLRVNQILSGKFLLAYWVPLALRELSRGTNIL